MDETFENQKIDLLKIDIEGSELEFIQREIAFLQSSVARVVCEWHTWHVSFDDIHSFFLANKFELFVIVETDENGGVAVFNNTRLLPGNHASQKRDSVPLSPTSHSTA
jgi:hypothetical protein